MCNTRNHSDTLGSACNQQASVDLLSAMGIFRVPFPIVFPGAGSPGVNVWHIQTTNTSGGSELADANVLVGYLRTFYDSIKAYYPTGTTITLGTVTEETTEREIVPAFAPVAGIGTSSAPQMLALVVTWKSTIAARRGRGRTFIGPLSTASVQTDGTPVDAVRTAIAAAANALVASSVSSTNGQVGVWGYSAAKTPGKANPRNPADAKVFRAYTAYATRDLFGVLRSRRD